MTEFVPSGKDMLFVHADGAMLVHRLRSAWSR